MARHAMRIRHVLGLLACCACVLSAGAGAGAYGVSQYARAAGAAALSVTLGAIAPGGVIPAEFAFCAPAKQGHVTQGPNKSPAISWSKGPAGTASYAIIMVDPDVPSVFDSADKEGRTIPASLKRVDFYHWILVDIPATVTGLPAGADSSGVAARGKAPGPTRYGVRGINDYTKGMAGDPQAAGDYGGYDGPCPPWNDTIVHHYHFGVYALDVPHLGLSGKVTGPDAVKAMQGHVLAKGEAVGIYTLNPDVAKSLGIK